MHFAVPSYAPHVHLFASEHVCAYNTHAHIIPHTMYKYYFPGVKEITFNISEIVNF